MSQLVWKQLPDYKHQQECPHQRLLHTHSYVKIGEELLMGNVPIHLWKIQLSIPKHFQTAT